MSAIAPTLIAVVLATLVPTLGRAESLFYLDATTLSVSGGEANRMVTATGKPKLVSEQGTIRSDTMSLTVSSSTIEAAGHVSMDIQGGYLQSERIQFEQETGAAALDHGTIVVPDAPIYATGETLQFDQTERRIHAQRARFSTCTCELPEPPMWIRSSSVNAQVDGYAKLKAPILYIEGVPVFALPYMVLPTGQGRKTGFLFPQFGISVRDGLRIAPGFVWITGPRSEVYLEGLIQTARGVGGTASAAYSLRGIAGSLSIGHVSENLRTRYPDFSTPAWLLPVSASTTAQSDPDFDNSLVPISRIWNVATSHVARMSDWGRATFNSQFINKASAVARNASSLDEAAQVRIATEADFYGAGRYAGASLDAKLVSSLGTDLTTFQRLPRFTTSAMMLAPKAGLHTTALASMAFMVVGTDLADRNLQFAYDPKNFEPYGWKINAYNQWQGTWLTNESAGLRPTLRLEGFGHSYSDRARSDDATIASDFELGSRGTIELYNYVRLRRNFVRDADQLQHWPRTVVHTIEPYWNASLSQYVGTAAHNAFYINETLTQDAPIFGASAGVKNSLSTQYGTATLAVFAQAVSSQVTNTPWNPDVAWRTRLSLDVSMLTFLSEVGLGEDIATSVARSSAILQWLRWRARIDHIYAPTAYDGVAPTYFDSSINLWDAAGRGVSHDLYAYVSAPVLRRVDLWADARYSMLREEVVTWRVGTTIHSSCECWRLSARFVSLPSPATNRFEIAFWLKGIGGLNLSE